MQFADDIPTFFVKLPHTVRGLTTVDENGNPTVYLNERLAGAQQLHAYRHEQRHILRDDLYNAMHINAVEFDSENNA